MSGESIISFPLLSEGLGGMGEGEARLLPRPLGAHQRVVFLASHSRPSCQLSPRLSLSSCRTETITQDINSSQQGENGNLIYSSAHPEREGKGGRERYRAIGGRSLSLIRANWALPSNGSAQNPAVGSWRLILDHGWHIVYLLPRSDSAPSPRTSPSVLSGRNCLTDINQIEREFCTKNTHRTTQSAGETAEPAGPQARGQRELEGKANGHHKSSLASSPETL